MKSNIIIGLTGGIASGKTTVSEFIKSKGIVIVDADKIAKDIIYIPEVKEKLCKEFGNDIYIRGELDRKKLAEIVFSNKSNLEKLNQITHPIILEKIKYEFFKLNKKDIIVADIPLLFETKFDLNVDKTLTIITKESIQLERLMKRNNLTKEEALKRINSQMSIKEKIKRSDYVIENNGSIEELKNKIEDFLKSIKKR